MCLLYRMELVGQGRIRYKEFSLYIKLITLTMLLCTTYFKYYENMNMIQILIVVVWRRIDGEG